MGIILLSSLFIILERIPYDPKLAVNTHIFNTIPTNTMVSLPYSDGSVYGHLGVTAKNKAGGKSSSAGNVGQYVTPAETRPSGIFPVCLREIGWYYGWHGNDFEYGTDYDCSFHTEIPALWSGKVIEAQRTCWNSNCTSSSGGVVMVVAMVPNYGLEATYYLHLDYAYVKKGDYVQKGEIIGLTGGQVGYGNWPTSSWFTSGPHIEIGWCAPFIGCPIGSNSNPQYAIAAAIN